MHVFDTQIVLFAVRFVAFELQTHAVVMLRFGVTEFVFHFCCFGTTDLEAKN